MLLACQTGHPFLRSPVTLTPVAERLAVKPLLPVIPPLL